MTLSVIRYPLIRNSLSGVALTGFIVGYYFQTSLVTGVISDPLSGVVLTGFPVGYYFQTSLVTGVIYAG